MIEWWFVIISGIEELCKDSWRVNDFLNRDMYIWWYSNQRRSVVTFILPYYWPLLFSLVIRVLLRSSQCYNYYHNPPNYCLCYALCFHYPTLSYAILSYAILSYPILSYPTQCYPISYCPIPSILSYPIQSNLIPSYPMLSYPILSYAILSHL